MLAGGSYCAHGDHRPRDRLATAAFAREELRPVALQYDETRGVPARAAAQGGRARADLLRPARPSTAAAGSRACATRCAVIEELSWGDSPIFWVIAQGGFFAGPILALGSAGAEGAVAAAALRPRAARVLGRDHRAGARLRLGGDRDDGAPRRRRLRARRPQEVHRQRADRRRVRRLRDRRARQPRRAGITAFVVERGDEGFVRGDAAPEDGQPLLPGRRARVRGVLRPRRPPARRRGRGVQRADARVRRRARAARRDRRSASAARRSSTRVEYATRATRVRQADPRVPGGLVPARRREAEARPGAAPDPPRRRPGRRRQAVLDRGRDGEARRLGGVVVRDVGGGADARRRGLRARLAGRRSGCATRSSTRSGTGRATSCG